jgi:hypothetical protein
MSDDDRMSIEGEMAKPFRVYTLDIDDKPYECVGEYETIAEVRAHRWRLDKRYKIQVPDGPKFLTRQEFGEWTKTQASGL